MEDPLAYQDNLWTTIVLVNLLNTQEWMNSSFIYSSLPLTSLNYLYHSFFWNWFKFIFSGQVLASRCSVEGIGYLVSHIYYQMSISANKQARDVSLKPKCDSVNVQPVCLEDHPWFTKLLCIYLLSFPLPQRGLPSENKEGSSAIVSLPLVSKIIIRIDNG